MYLSSAIRFAQTYPKTATTLGSLGVAAMVVLAFINAMSIPTVYKSYSDEKVVSVVDADGHKLPPVEPRGRYDTVWVE